MSKRVLGLAAAAAVLAAAGAAGAQAWSGYETSYGADRYGPYTQYQGEFGLGGQAYGERYGEVYAQWSTRELIGRADRLSAWIRELSQDGALAPHDARRAWSMLRDVRARTEREMYEHGVYLPPHDYRSIEGRLADIERYVRREIG